MITSLVFYSGVYYISLILAIFSVPSIIATLWTSNRQMYRYRLLRSLNERERKSLPPHIIAEWMSVRSTVGYGNMLIMEVDRLNALRPAILQAALSAILLFSLFFFPGFAEDLIIWMILTLMVITVTVVAGYLTMRRYAQEYLAMAIEVEKEGREDLGVIYN